MIKLRFRVWCAARNLKASDVHRMTGIPYPTLRDLYYGRSKSIKISDLDTLCTVLKCDISDIIQHEKA